jgi:hypothetical protein
MPMGVAAAREGGHTATVTLFQELKRRNAFRVAAACIAFSWPVIQVVETLFPLFGLGDSRSFRRPDVRSAA